MSSSSFGMGKKSFDLPGSQNRLVAEQSKRERDSRALGVSLRGRDCVWETKGSHRGKTL